MSAVSGITFIGYVQSQNIWSQITYKSSGARKPNGDVVPLSSCGSPTFYTLYSLSRGNFYLKFFDYSMVPTLYLFIYFVTRLPTIL
jgi:hypothetical protein